jgi:ribosomal protein L27
VLFRSTTKGDLATFSTSVTRLPVGDNGDTLVADSSTATGLSYQVNSAAGKNKIINGDFNIWQRGTSFTPMSNAAYGPDRWQFGLSGDVANVSRQAFTPNDIVSIGYGDAQYFMRMEVVSSNGSARMEQKIEDVRTLANQSVTVSLWAKANTTTSLDLLFLQNFGSGGSSQITLVSQAVTLTTSWQRFSKTFTIPSVSGKTIGTGSYLALALRETTASTNVTFDIWGVQVEAGSTATAFQTATGTIQGELAACQRYYCELGNNLSGSAENSTTAQFIAPYPIIMRATPSISLISGRSCYIRHQTADFTSASPALVAPTIREDSLWTLVNGFTSLTANGVANSRNNSATARFIAASAEL